MWNRGPVSDLVAEKESARERAAVLFEKLLTLESKLDHAEYEKLWIKFYNLKLVTAAWTELLKVFVSYADYFDGRNPDAEINLNEALNRLLQINEEGIEKLGSRFYCQFFSLANPSSPSVLIVPFVEEVRECFLAEKNYANTLGKDESVLDYIVCGGAMEGHKLMKEVNFSDTLVRDGLPYRIGGNRMGMKWSRITAHGWFSYEVKVKPNAENVIKIKMGSNDDQLVAKVTINDEETVISQPISGVEEFTLKYQEREGKTTARIRFDKISAHVPCVFTICVMK